MAEKYGTASQEACARLGIWFPEMGPCTIPSLRLKHTSLDKFSTTPGLFPTANLALGIRGQAFPMELQRRALPNKEVWQSKNWTKAQTIFFYVSCWWVRFFQNIGCFVCAQQVIPLQDHCLLKALGSLKIRLLYGIFKTHPHLELSNRAANNIRYFLINLLLPYSSNTCLWGLLIKC